MQIPRGQGRLQSWIEASSVVAAALYGLGWIMTARFLGRFGVAPEEVGFSFSYLLIRVVFVVLLFLGLAGGIFWALTRLAERTGQSEIRIPRPSVANAIQLALAAAGIAAVVVVVLQAVAGGLSWSLLAGLVFWLGVVAILSGLLALWRIGDQGRVAVWATDYFSSLKVSTRTVLRILAVAVAVAAALGLLAVPFVAASSFADRIEDGDEVQMSVLPGVPGLSALRVNASTTDGTDLAPGLDAEGCLHLFGSAGGVVVLYDHDSDTVLRLSQERVTLAHPCEEDDP